jgi:hypothetical protein
MSELQMKYFVLKPAGDDDYAIASRRAMMAYAAWIGDHGNPDLAAELGDWVERKSFESFKRRAEGPAERRATMMEMG